MIEKYLWIAGSLPFIVLGTIHLLYTFFTNKLSARNTVLEKEMKDSFLVLTKETSMWKAWIGFNASHSSGAIYIGLINLLLAARYFNMVKSPVFLLLNIITALFYLWLAKKYWFSIPFKGILISTCCFIAAAIMILFQ